MSSEDKNNEDLELQVKRFIPAGRIVLIVGIAGVFLTGRKILKTNKKILSVNEETLEFFKNAAEVHTNSVANMKNMITHCLEAGHDFTYYPGLGVLMEQSVRGGVAA